MREYSEAAERSESDDTARVEKPSASGDKGWESSDDAVDGQAPTKETAASERNLERDRPRLRSLRHARERYGKLQESRLMDGVKAGVDATAAAKAAATTGTIAAIGSTGHAEQLLRLAAEHPAETTAAGIAGGVVAAGKHLWSMRQHLQRAQERQERKGK